MKHLIKHGTLPPSVNDLESYQLGWCTGNKKLYINDNGSIRVVSSTVVLGENVMVATKKQSLSNNDTFILDATTDDHLQIIFSRLGSTRALNLKIQPLDYNSFFLKNAVSHKEYNTSNGYKSETNFAELETDSININIAEYNDAIDENIYFELFFTINDYDYRIEFRAAEETSTSVSIICTLSRTISR